jgi:hypothetical protein
MRRRRLPIPVVGNVEVQTRNLAAPFWWLYRREARFFMPRRILMGVWARALRLKVCFVLPATALATS